MPSPFKFRLLVLGQVSSDREPRGCRRQRMGGWLRCWDRASADLPVVSAREKRPSEVHLVQIIPIRGPARRGRLPSRSRGRGRWGRRGRVCGAALCSSAFHPRPTLPRTLLTVGHLPGLHSILQMGFGNVPKPSVFSTFILDSISATYRTSAAPERAHRAGRRSYRSTGAGSPRTSSIPGGRTSDFLCQYTFLNF